MKPSTCIATHRKERASVDINGQLYVADFCTLRIHCCHVFQFSPTYHDQTYGKRPHVTSCCKLLKITLPGLLQPPSASSNFQKGDLVWPLSSRHCIPVDRGMAACLCG